jgi:hypothetical protein
MKQTHDGSIKPPPSGSTHYCLERVIPGTKRRAKCLDEHGRVAHFPVAVPVTEAASRYGVGEMYEAVYERIEGGGQ